MFCTENETIATLFRVSDSNSRLKRGEKNALEKKEERAINFLEKAPINRIRDVGYALNRENGPLAAKI